MAAAKAEQDASTKAYAVCLMSAAKRLDDHISDATTIAQGAMSACAAEFNEDVRAYSRDLGPEGEQSVASKLRQGSLSSAIQFVLTNRKAALAKS
jgi:hypothetical protein